MFIMFKMGSFKHERALLVIVPRNLKLGLTFSQVIMRVKLVISLWTCTRIVGSHSFVVCLLPSRSQISLLASESLLLLNNSNSKNNYSNCSLFPTHLSMHSLKKLPKYMASVERNGINKKPKFIKIFIVARQWYDM